MVKCFCDLCQSECYMEQEFIIPGGRYIDPKDGIDKPKYWRMHLCKDCQEELNHTAGKLMKKKINL